MSAAGAPVEQPVPRRFEPRAVGAILHREWRVFRRVWFSYAFGSLVEPVLLLAAFGFGFGALVAEVAGLSYLEFIATGAIAIGILFSATFPGLINGYFRRKEQQLYDGVLGAPVSIPELVTGEALWYALRVTIVAVVTVVVAVTLGVRPGAGVVVVPLIAVVAGFGFASAGAAFAALLRSTHSFDLVIVGVVVPVHIIAGTFFPLDTLPGWVQVVGQLNPLTHVVELLRIVTFATAGLPAALGHLAVILVFDLLAWLAAVRLLRRALID